MKYNTITPRSLPDRFGLFYVILMILVPFISANGQSNVNSRSIVPLRGASFQQSAFLSSTSPAYREDVSRLLLQEANHVAKDLSLPEKMPISETNIIRVTIYPPRLAANMGAVGNVVTSNYIYYVSIGHKFSALTRTHLQQEDNQLKSKYIEPISQMDTNAAFQLATQFLVAASMDVTALNRDCDAHIDIAAAGPDDEHFVPLYSFSWAEKGKGEHRGNAASVEVFLPTKSLRQMHVSESKYILRQPLQITNPDLLLVSTNPPSKRLAYIIGARQYLMTNSVMRTNNLNKATTPSPAFNRPVANNRW